MKKKPITPPPMPLTPEAADGFAASITGATAATIVAQARAALVASASDLSNVPPEQDDTSDLFDLAQQEERDAICLVCGVPQATHWTCACCTAHGHLLPRSTVLPDYCQDCVDDGSAERHQERLRGNVGNKR